MKADRASHTAEGAAALRAAGRFERSPALRNPDHLALSLIRPSFRWRVSTRPVRFLSLAFYERLLPGMYDSHLARTHHYDRLVIEGLERGARQYVILGAGLDSRPYRLGSALEGVTIFEIDHPASSAFKRERLAAAGLANPAVRYVEVDFLSQDTRTRLLESGLDPALPTLFTWEGVTMYLNAETVQDMFRFVASLAAGSSIAFDYVYPGFYETPERWPTARKHLDYVAKAGEPYTFGLEYDQVTALVEACGLQLRSNLDAATLGATYLQGRDSITPWYAMALAGTPTT